MRILVLALVLAVASGTAAMAQPYQRNYDQPNRGYDQRDRQSNDRAINPNDRAYDSRDRNDQRDRPDPRFEQGARAYDDRYDNRDRRSDSEQNRQGQGNNVVIPLDRLLGK